MMFMVGCVDVYIIEQNIDSIKLIYGLDAWSLQHN